MKKSKNNRSLHFMVSGALLIGAAACDNTTNERTVNEPAPAPEPELMTNEPAPSPMPEDANTEASAEGEEVATDDAAPEDAEAAADDAAPEDAAPEDAEGDADDADPEGTQSNEPVPVDEADEGAH